MEADPKVVFLIKLFREFILFEESSPQIVRMKDTVISLTKEADEEIRRKSIVRYLHTSFRNREKGPQ